MPESLSPGQKQPLSNSGGDDLLLTGKLWDEALAAFYREDDDTALELFLLLFETDPNNLRCAYLAALCACNLNDEEELEKIYRKVRKGNPRHPYTLGCEAVWAMFYANYERAEHLFLTALRSLPDEIDLNIGLGILYEQMGKEEQSAEIYRKVLEKSPDNIRARISLGISYAMNGEYLSAFEEYQYAKRLDPSVENPHQHLGRDFYADGLIEEATQEFIQAIIEEPDEPVAYFFLLDCYKRLARFDDALDIYQAIKERFADQPEVLSGLYEQFQMYREALPLLEQLRQENPGDPELLLRLSNAYQAIGDLDSAIEVLKSALAQLPESGPLWSNLARLYYQTQNYQHAVASAQRAIQLNPYDTEAYSLLSDALIFLGRFEEAEATAREMEIIRDKTWQRYQQRFAGIDETEEEN